MYGQGQLPPGGAFKNPAGISLVGFVPSTIPTPRIPRLGSSSIAQIFTTTFAVFLVGFVESIAVAKLYAQKHGYEINSGTELKAVGLTSALFFTNVVSESHICNNIYIFMICADIFGSLVGSFSVMGVSTGRISYAMQCSSSI